MVLDPEAEEWLDVPHVERPERMKRVLQVLEGSGVIHELERIPAREATEAEVGLVHTPEMIGTVRAGSGPEPNWSNCRVAWSNWRSHPVRMTPPSPRRPVCSGRSIRSSTAGLPASS